VLTAVAGNRPGYEEACRALFAREDAAFEKLVARWPKDIRGYAQERLADAVQAEAEAP
jgi:hypothetical protein